MSKVNKHSNFSHLLSYFKGVFDSKENHNIEKQIMHDQFESDAYDGLSDIQPEELEKDYLWLKSEIHKKDKKFWFISNFRSWAAAASLLITCGVGTYIYMTLTKNHSHPLTILKEKKSNKKESSTYSKNILLDNQSQIAQNSEKTAPASNLEKKYISNKQFLSEISEQKDSTVSLAQKKESLITTNNYSSGANNNIAPQIITESDVKTERALTESKYLTGVVVDDNGVGIPGASIIVKGTDKKIISDINGKFKISVTNDSIHDVLVSSIGYNQISIPISPSKTEEIILRPNNVSLNEMVVIGYGAKKKSDVSALKNNQKSSVLKDRTNKKSEDFSKDNIEQSDIEPIENLEYISEKNRYPQEDQLIEFFNINKTCQNLPEGCNGQKVKLKVTLTPDGKIEKIKIMYSENKIYSDEARRILFLYPDWHSPKQNNIYIKSTYVFILTF